MTEPDEEPAFDVVTVGDVVVDFTYAGLTASGNALFERNAGGGPANVVATVARLGGRAAFMGMVGDDALGRYLRDALASSGVDTRGIRTASELGTRVVFIELDETNDRSFVPYASPRSDLAYSSTELDRELPASARIFHTTMLAHQTPSIRTASCEAITIARSSGAIISCDPNWAPSVSMDPVGDRQTIQDILQETDVLKVSQVELEFLTQTDRPEHGAHELHERGVEVVVVTMGERGSYFVSPAGAGFVQSPRVDAVDTTGAGDAFMGGLLHQLSTRISLGDSLESLTLGEWEDILLFANASGAHCATRRGSLLATPRLEDVTALLDSRASA